LSGEFNIGKYFFDRHAELVSAPHMLSGHHASDIAHGYLYDEVPKQVRHDVPEDFAALVGVVSNKLDEAFAQIKPSTKSSNSHHKRHGFVGDNTNKGEKSSIL
jgi:hypothetical protein